MIARSPFNTRFLLCLVAALSLGPAQGVFSQGVKGVISQGAAGQDAASQESTAGLTDAADDHQGHNHGVGVGDVGAAESASAPIDSAAETAAMIKEFKEKAPPELIDEGLAAAEKFVAASDEFKAKVLQMRHHYILFVNGYNEDRQRYFVLRNESRELMNQLYRKALDVIDFFPHPVAMRYVVTILEQRFKHDVYDAETLEGAAKLLDYGVRLRYVALAAARAGMCAGDFPLAESLYQNLQEDEIEDQDKAMMIQFDAIKKQFETEQAQLRNDPEDLPQVRLKTSRGEIIADLYIHEAPSTVAHFINLVESGFYDGLDFFQVVEGLLALTGDPLGDGSSRPERYLADEHGRDIVRMPLAGSLVMAKLPGPDKDFIPNTAGTQFAILFMPLPSVSEQQTVFGRIVKGLDVLGALRRVDPHKEKKKGEVILPPDRILEAEILNRPETLPEVIYADPPVMLP
ncbi:putative peptidyl-prolyl cis-trans isomerase [Stieleria maiorica]|uniref:peptidylprolyl isomerase n=1 Tax=Stieleria maiorica TaxID=2795974 RepID=A0A5B9MHE0_9BACT|nr:peptidylprolyl isomerase [Stieleria maiorica]QEF99929.1 putative peptidyl-prolyl cis-trans isomerase [Stieleria maiorica]